MKEETKASHTTYENNRVSGIEQQEHEDAWRNKTTYPTQKEILKTLVQRQDPTSADNYVARVDGMKDATKSQHTAYEVNRQAAIDAQEKADAWRDGFTPNKGPVVSLSQHRAIPDGYTFNYDNLETSIKNAHDAAEAARVAAVNA